MRPRLTFANVMSVIAVFIALGGASYAAFKLPKNSVGSKQLRKNAVNSAKVKNNSLRAVDFKAGQLLAGATGPPGPSGATNVVMRTGPDFTVDRNEFEGGKANCQPGERATGGGALTGNVKFRNIVSSFPTPNPNEEFPENGVTPTGWRVWVSDPDIGISEAPETLVTPYVICASP
jgi:hypothetical protein